jgi:hypothetical protein
MLSMDPNLIGFIIVAITIGNFMMLLQNNSDNGLFVVKLTGAAAMPVLLVLMFSFMIVGHLFFGSLMLLIAVFIFCIHFLSV